MAFIEKPRFPESISYGSVGGPEFNTDVIVIHSGQDIRNQNWEVARSVYDVSHGVQSQAELDTLIEFFRSVRGRLHGFRYKDWSDFQVLLTSSNGDGGRGVTAAVVSGSVYQLYKRYITAGGGLSIDRKITKVVSSNNVTSQSFVLVGSGGGIIATTSYTLFPNSGRVTFAGSLGAPTWLGEFDVPCRFDTDRMPVKLETYNVYTWGQIPIVELKL